MALWKRLVLSQSPPALPKLYIQHNINEAGYRIAVTDLTCLWEETLDWRAIVQRSLNDSTTIDLLEKDQHAIFIEYLRAALEGEEGTTLAIFRGQEESKLTLHVTSKLPGGFQPLQWTIHLAPKTPRHLAEQLTVPALIALQDAEDASKELVIKLAEKDQVVETLMARITQLGIPLNELFPRVVPFTKGRRPTKVDDTVFYQKVPGLKRFDPNDFRDSRSLRPKSPDQTDPDKIFQEGLKIGQSHEWISAGEWWQVLPLSRDHLQVVVVPDSQPKPSLPHRESTHDFESQRSNGVGGNSWQESIENGPKGNQDAQGLDPHQGQPVSLRTDALTIPDSSSRTQYLSEGRQVSSQPQSATNSPRKPRLGRIGGRKQAEPEASTVPEQDDAATSSQGAEGGKSRTQSPNPKPPRGKIGRIGGARGSKDALPSKGAGHTSVSPKVEPDTPPRLGDHAEIRDGSAASLELELPKQATSEERRLQERARIKREAEAPKKTVSRKKRKF